MNTTTLIPTFNAVINDEPAQLCNARELHTNLLVGRDFSNWIKERIEQYGFVEGEDFILCSPNPASKKGRGGHNRTDYHLTLDMAKELAMIENNDIGRQIRRYLIRLEKKAVAAGLKIGCVVNRAQVGEMSARIAERFPVGKDRPYAWSRFNNHFRLSSYKDLPADKFAEALAYIDQMPVKQAPALENAIPQGDFLRGAVHGEISEKALNELALRELLKPGRRFIAIFGKSGDSPMPIMYSIPEEAQILTPDEIITHVGKANGFPRDLLPALITAAASRLQPALIRKGGAA